MRNKNQIPILKSQINCSIKSKLLEEIYKLNLKASEVLEFGINFKLAELDMIEEYPENKLSEKIKQLQEIIKLRCPNKQED